MQGRKPENPCADILERWLNIQHGWGLCVVTGLSFLPTPTLNAESIPMRLGSCILPYFTLPLVNSEQSKPLPLQEQNSLYLPSEPSVAQHPRLFSTAAL